MPFLLDGNPTQSEISDAVNYLLSNFSGSVSSDPNTGVIVGSNNEIIGYLYRFLAIKYSDSYDGSVNFSDVPTGRLYYGLRNNNNASESSNPADYIWTKATGGFGSTKFVWYQTTGGRAIQLAVATAAPDTGWVQDSGASIDLDIVTSANIPVIAESFVTYFTPPVMQVPRTGSPLAPVFTNIKAVLFATDQGVVIPYSGATTDTSVDFVNNTWRIGNSSTTGFGDISYTNITVGNPTDAGDYAIWPDPTAMASSPAFITVPVRYKNSLGVVTQASVAKIQFTFADPGATGPAGSSLDISGYTSFVQNAGGAYTPANATLSAVLSNVTSPTYAWTISGATPTTASTASVVVTPTSSSTGVDVTLTVNGSNLLSPISKTIKMPVVYNGAPGTAGANGVMSAFPTIYIWTGSSTPPTRPTTTSTYTWSSGSYTAPSGWSTSAPSNTTAGNYLWSITIPLNEPATATISLLDWTSTSNPIRAIAYNGANGTNGTNGSNGSNGAPGSATFVITRSANDSSPPTNSEVNALIGRNPVAGDICTVSYNASNNAVVYRYVTSWTLFTTYITGSLIVQNTITGDKVAANTITGTNIAGTTITASNIAAGTITANEIAASTITAAKMVAGTITASSGILADAVITTAKIGTAQVDTLQIAGNAVTVPVSAISSTNTASISISLTAGNNVLITGYVATSYPTAIVGPSRNLYINYSGVSGSGTVNTVSNVYNSLDIGYNVWSATPISGIFTATTSGSHTFTITTSNNSTGGGSAIQVIGMKR